MLLALLSCGESAPDHGVWRRSVLASRLQGVLRECRVPQPTRSFGAWKEMISDSRVACAVENTRSPHIEDLLLLPTLLRAVATPTNAYAPIGSFLEIRGEKAGASHSAMLEYCFKWTGSIIQANNTDASAASSQRHKRSWSIASMPDMDHGRTSLAEALASTDQRSGATLLSIDDVEGVELKSALKTPDLSAFSFVMVNEAAVAEAEGVHGLLEEAGLHKTDAIWLSSSTLYVRSGLRVEAVVSQAALPRSGLHSWVDQCWKWSTRVQKFARRP